MICGVCRCGRISLRLGRRGLRIPRVRARIDHARRASATQRVSASRSASGVPSHACAARYLCLCDWCLLGLGAQRASDAGSTHRVSRGPAIATAIVPSLCAAIGSCCGSAACPCECTRVCRVGRILFFTIRDRSGRWESGRHLRSKVKQRGRMAAECAKAGGCANGVIPSACIYSSLAAVGGVAACAALSTSLRYVCMLACTHTAQVCTQCAGCATHATPAYVCPHASRAFTHAHTGTRTHTQAHTHTHTHTGRRSAGRRSARRQALCGASRPASARAA